MKAFLTKTISLVLVFIFICSIVPTVKVEAEAYYSASRDDGVWLFPLASSYYYCFSDWAGCACCGICPFCGITHLQWNDAGASHAHEGQAGGHNGIDIAPGTNANVYASANGVVLGTGYSNARGYYIVIKHDIGNGWAYYSYVQHLQENSILVAANQNVAVGSTIAKVGATGVGSGLHLHFGIVMAPSNYTCTQVFSVDESGVWLKSSGYTSGRIITNPQNGGTGMESVDYHRGSITYTFDKNSVSFPKVSVNPTGISLNEKQVTMTVGESKTVTATVTPSNSNNKNVIWTSGDTSVATVSNGVIKAVSPGGTTITATNSAGHKANIDLVINPVDIISDGVVNYGGHTYEIIHSVMTWKQAQEYCEKQGGHLATITSKEENFALYELIKKYGKNNYDAYFIGLTDENSAGTYTWITGEKLSYRNWEPSEPSNSMWLVHHEKYQNYGAITKDGFWNDINNFSNSTTDKHGFICEYDYVSESTLPNGANPDDYEKVTEYRYRDKQTKTSTSATISGWTKYDSKTAYGSWGATQTTTSKPTECDTLKITATSTNYKYYHYWNYYGGCNCIDSITYGTNKGYCEIYLSYQLGAVSMEDQGGKQAYGSYSCGKEGFNYWFYGGTQTTYSYQTRNKTTTNYFYKYGEWSAWSETVVESTSNRQVETRTVYRLKTETQKCAAPKIESVKNTTGGVKITWSGVNGAEKYRVYRKVKGGSWTKIGDTSSTSLTDKTAKSGKTYYYTVKAINEAGGGSYNKTGFSIKYVSAPKLAKIENGKNYVKVTWGKVSSVDGYIVYRKVSGATSWTKVSTIKKGSTVSYKDTQVSSGKTYTYTIKAYDGSATSGYSSCGITIKFLAMPKISKVSNTTSGVKISWNKVNGADKYRVYRKVKGGSWTKIGDASSTSLTDKTAKSGKTYYYTVKAYKGSTKSSYNTTGTAKKYLASPICSAKNTTSGIKVSWNKIPGASGYIIYRKTNTSDWRNIGKTASGTTTSFTDKKYNEGVIYAYTVRAYTGNTKSSFYSDKCSIKAKIKGDITAENVKDVFYPILRQINSTNNNYYAVGFVKNKDGSYKNYAGKLPEKYSASIIYKFASVKTVSELKDYLKKYMTTDFINEYCFFNSLVEYKGELYILTGPRGSTTYNANSIKLVGRYGNGYYISADMHNSGDGYSDTKVFYVKKVKGEYVVEGLYAKQEYEVGYIPSDYKPIYK